MPFNILAKVTLNMIYTLIGLSVALFLLILWRLQQHFKQQQFQAIRTEEQLKIIYSQLNDIGEKSLHNREQLIQQLQRMQLETKEQLTHNHYQAQQSLRESLEQSHAHIQKTVNEFRQQFDKHQVSALTTLQESLQSGLNQVGQHIVQQLKQSTEHLTQRVDKLTDLTGQQLQSISGQVEKRLTEGFDKTTKTFTDIVKRLALIDEAQKKITELSSNVVSLQEILSDKQSRGTFGETQLSGLIHNVLPEKHFSLQYTLSNGKRVDCMLFLPEPTGNLAIDAKFPLEGYRLSKNQELQDTERKLAEQQFRTDVRKHITDIASKYIIPGETSDGAMMFIPAEAIFAEIHAAYPELVEYAQKNRVWIVSPTTMMAILTTARAVLKDEATRKQVHIIQEHLAMLSKDFGRFQKRMGNLAKHIEQANSDVQEVTISANKITNRFSKIEKVELDSQDEVSLETAEPAELFEGEDGES